MNSDYIAQHDRYNRVPRMPETSKGKKLKEHRKRANSNPNRCTAFIDFGTGRRCKNKIYHPRKNLLDPPLPYQLFCSCHMYCRWLLEPASIIDNEDSHHK